MDNGYEILEIIILIMIAAFIGLRLRSVLGRRPDDQSNRNFPSRPVKTQTTKPPKQSVKNEWISAPDGLNQQTLKNLSINQIAAVKKIFGPISPTGLSQFIEGAKKAYGLTLKGFWSDGMEEMSPYIDKEVLKQFEKAIKARKKNGEKLENRLVEILDVEVEDAEIDGPIAEISLRFRSEIVAALKNKSGKLIEGSLSDTVEVVDIWTFARNLKAKDPNWMLVATSTG